MRIKLLDSLTDGSNSLTPGSVVNWDDAEATGLIAAGIAESAEDATAADPAKPARGRKRADAPAGGA